MNTLIYSLLFFVSLSSTSYTSSLNFNKAVSYRDINSFIKSFQIRSVEEFLEKLPPSYKKHHTLMHKSNSIQDASFMNPRAILFGKDAQVIFTFNGDKSQHGYSAIETAVFNHYTNKYEYREITFSPNRSALAQVSASTPSKCIRCHGVEQTPIWNHYNQWPGAYGSDDDTFSSEEYENLTNFLAAAKKHPRYSLISELQESYSFSRKVRFVRGKTASRSVYQHNRAFTAKLFTNLFKRIADDVKKIKEYDYLKPAIFALLSKCYLDKSNNDRSEGLPTNQMTLNSIVSSTLDGKRANHKYVIRPEYFLYYFFQKLNYSYEHWIPNEESIKNPLLLKNGLQMVGPSLLYNLVKDDDEYKGYFDISEKEFIDQTLVTFAKLKKNKCESLLDNSAGKLGQFKDDIDRNSKLFKREKKRLKRDKLKSFFKFKGQKAPIPKTCLRCHSNKEDDLRKIFIPFNSLHKKENKLLVHKMLKMITPDKTGKARMPLNFEDEKDRKKYFKKDYPRLKRYLKSLLKK